MISMLGMDRRKFMRGSAAASLSLVAPADLLAQPVGSPPASNWDAGSVRLLLPAVSDTRMLIKVSFQGPLSDAPVLHVGGTSVRGRMGDTRGEHWHFYVTDLQPGRPYPLSLIGPSGGNLCEPWELSTFPAPDERPGGVSPVDLYLRRRPRGSQIPSDHRP
jgi:hypothetical protein